MTGLHEPATRIRRALIALAIGSIFLAGGSSLAADEPKQGVAIGVAPFERVGGVDADVPDIAMMLARRLSTMGVEKVVSPRELGVPPTAEPSAADVADWAARSGVQTLVVGRTTALGSRLSMDARLHAGASGQPLGQRFFAEAKRTKDLGLAIEDLAQSVLAQIESGEVSSLPVPVAATATTAEAAESAPDGSPPLAAADPSSDEPAPEPAPRKGMGLDKSAPMSIQSDQLESIEGGGARRFVFKGNVRAVQGTLKITSQRLEAFYQAGRSQPHKIVATGVVEMRQSGRIAHCDRAIFYRAEDRIVCQGDVAELEQGCDIVRGREIIFHTATEVMKVNGAADVRITPEEDGCGSTAAVGTGE